MPAARGVTALAGAVGAYGIANAALSTTTSLFLSDAVHATALAIGLFFTWRGALGIVVNLAGGWVSDRLSDRRRPLAVAALAGAAGSLCLAALRSYLAVLTFTLVLLSISGVCFAQLFAYAKEHAQARGRAVTPFTSTIRSVFSAAWVIGPPFGFYLLTRYGFGPLYVAVAGLFGVAALLGRWVVPAVPASEEPTGRTPLGRLGRPTYLLLLAIVLLSVVNQMYSIDVALYVTKDLRHGSSLVGWMAGLGAGLEIPVMIVAGRVADRFGMLRLVIASAAGAVVFFCLLPLAGSAPLLLALQLPNAAWTAVALSIPMIMVQQEVPGGAGTSASVYSTAYTTAGVIAGAVTGVTAAAVGYRDVFWVCAGLSALAAVLLVCRAGTSENHRRRYVTK